MRRISEIRNRREADIEERREGLRNIRWQRRKSEILTLAAVVWLVTSGKLPPVLHWLQGITGI